MNAPAIRPIAIGIFWRDDQILVGRAHDVQKNEYFYRPPGGGMEFGERAVETLRREIREELHAEIDETRLLGVLENTFQWQGSPAHEIAFVFEARFQDAHLYSLPELTLFEAGWEGRLTWESLSDFRDRIKTLYPEGLLELLSDLRSRS